MTHYTGSTFDSFPFRPNWSGRLRKQFVVHQMQTITYSTNTELLPRLTLKLYGSLAFDLFRIWEMPRLYISIFHCFKS